MCWHAGIPVVNYSHICKDKGYAYSYVATPTTFVLLKGVPFFQQHSSIYVLNGRHKLSFLTIICMLSMSISSPSPIFALILGRNLPWKPYLGKFGTSLYLLGFPYIWGKSSWNLILCLSNPLSIHFPFHGVRCFLCHHLIGFKFGNPYSFPLFGEDFRGSPFIEKGWRSVLLIPPPNFGNFG